MELPHGNPKERCVVGLSSYDEFLHILLSTVCVASEKTYGQRSLYLSLPTWRTRLEVITEFILSMQTIQCLIFDLFTIDLVKE